jgi:hypothetical protein
MSDAKKKTRYDLLKRESLLSWTVIKWGWENHTLSFSEVLDYAILQLESSSDENIAILAGLSETDKDTMCQILDGLASKETVEGSKERWILASLLSIQESGLDDQGKLDQLQMVYADFDYPESLSKCSIYYVDPEKRNSVKVGDILSDPLMEMQKVIEQLFHEFGKKA